VMATTMMTAMTMTTMMMARTVTAMMMIMDILVFENANLDYNNYYKTFQMPRYFLTHNYTDICPFK
jgi:hypothetical protein